MWRACCTKSPECPLGIGAAGIEQDTEALRMTIGVNPLADGACWVAAAHGKRLDEKVRERVQQDVRSARKEAFNFAVLHPKLMPAREGVEPPLHGRPLEPNSYGLRP